MALTAQLTPMSRLKRLVVSTIRASIITCGSGESSRSTTESTASMFVGSSLMIRAFVRRSTTTLPRCVSRPDVPVLSRRATWSALA